MTAPRERFGDEVTERPTESVSTPELLLAIGAWLAGGAGLVSWIAWIAAHASDTTIPVGLWRHDLMVALAGIGAAYVVLWQRGSRTRRYGAIAVAVALLGAVAMAVTA